MTSNVDPAEVLNLEDVLTLDAFLNLFRDTQRELITTVRESFPNAASPVYEAFTIEFAASPEPILIAGLDRSRKRMLLRASTTDVFVGNRSQLAGGFGYVLPTQAGDEFRSTDELYVRYIPETPDPTTIVRVSIWIEKEAQ